MGFGALNEVIEFTVTLLIQETNVGGYVNNSLDLVFNMCGAVLAALVIRWRYSVA
jgi:glycopeptide antibiotics resistance protein